jgi:hypothetical protein
MRSVITDGTLSILLFLCFVGMMEMYAALTLPLR